VLVCHRCLAEVMRFVTYIQTSWDEGEVSSRCKRVYSAFYWEEHLHRTKTNEFNNTNTS